MAWVVATVSVLSTLIVCAAVLVLWRMLQLRRQPGSFRCKIRVLAGWSPGFKTNWPRRVARAMWASNVLIVYPARAVIRVHPVAVTCAHGAVHAVPKHEVTRLGPDPVALDLLLDEGSRLEIAAPAQSRTLLCGPYVVAQVMPNRGSRKGE
jgi:hypothetical protein